MRFDRKTVFDGLRRMAGHLDDVQVSVIAATLDEWERRKLTDIRWLAYMLATGWHEAHWKPVREIGRGKGKKYGKPHRDTGHIYYGRGCPTQLTWYDNYLAMGKILNLPLAADPDLALTVPVGVSIGYEGMLRGTFTGKKLADYFSATSDDPVNARRIINSTDKAKQIADYHYTILRVLLNAQRDEPANPSPVENPARVETEVRDGTAGGAAGGAGAIVVSGGAAVAAGYDWKLVGMLAGCALAVVAIGWLIFKLRKQA